MKLSCDRTSPNRGDEDRTTTAATPITRSSPRVAGGRVREALDHLDGLVLDGLRHGYFDYSITCEIGNGGKRHLVIRAGKSHQFYIAEEELPR